MNGGDVRFFDRIAPVYDLVMPAADREVLTRALGVANRDVERVVDVGGGTGRASEALPTAEAIVVDPSLGMLRRVRGNALPVRGSADRLPVRDRAVDAVTIVDALHHIPDPRAAIEEAERTLRAGGVLVVQDFDPSTVRGRGLARMEGLLGMRSRFLAPERVIERMQAVGLEPVAISDGFAYSVAGRKADRS